MKVTQLALEYLKEQGLEIDFAEILEGLGLKVTSHPQNEEEGQEGKGVIAYHIEETTLKISFVIYPSSKGKKNDIVLVDEVARGDAFMGEFESLEELTEELGEFAEYILGEYQEQKANRPKSNADKPKEVVSGSAVFAVRCQEKEALICDLKEHGFTQGSLPVSLPGDTIVYINLNNKSYALGLPSIVGEVVGGHAIKAEEFKQIAEIYRSYEGQGTYS